MTLSFIPKLIAMVACCCCWRDRGCCNLVVDFTRRLFQNIPALIG